MRTLHACTINLSHLVSKDACRPGLPPFGTRMPPVKAKGDLATLACLQQLGLRLGAGLVPLAVSQGAPLPALRCLAEHGALWGRSQLAHALRRLEAAYQSPRDAERQEVEAGLRGRRVPGRGQRRMLTTVICCFSPTRHDARSGRRTLWTAQLGHAGYGCVAGDRCVTQCHFGLLLLFVAGSE